MAHTLTDNKKQWLAMPNQASYSEHYNVWKVPIVTPDGTIVDYASGRTKDEAIYKAKLYAASCQMLEVLVEVEEVIRTLDRADTTLHIQVKQAIHKATYNHE